MRIRTRIFGTYVALAAVLVGSTAALLYDSVGDEARAGIESRVATGVRLVAVWLEGWEGAVDEGRLDERIDVLAATAEARLTIIAPDGRVMADSEFDGTALAAVENHAGRAEVREAMRTGESGSVRYSRSVGTDLLYRARRVDGGPWAGVARMAVPMTRVSEAQAEARRELLVAVLVGLAISLAGGGLLARYLSRPIGELRSMAGRLTAGDLDARARVDTGDELEDLAATLNAAASGLAEQLARAEGERDRVEAVLQGMVEGVVVTDAAGRIALANTALREMFALAGPTEGRTPIEALRNPAAADVIEEAAEKREVVVREIRVSWPLVRTFSLHASGLAAGGAVAVFHDVTALKRVDEMRRDFVANVSHELQTPLTTLAGYGEALTESAGDPRRVAEMAEVVRRQSARMSALVRDLLNLSRLESEGFAPEREVVDIDALVREVADAWAERAAERGLALDVEIEPGLEVRGDRRLLHQALSNLVENAVKYVPADRAVRIGARAVHDGVELLVSDTGGGIPTEDLPRIFERFYRVDKGRARSRGGTGLGLAIVKHVAEVHGGRVEVESAPGRGAKFRVILPG